MKVWIKLPTNFHPQHRINGMVSVDPVEGWEEYVSVKEIEAQLALAKEALEFYANREHIEVLERGINFDMLETKWRVAHPYIGGVEYGQTARAALEKLK